MVRTRGEGKEGKEGKEGEERGRGEGERKRDIILLIAEWNGVIFARSGPFQPGIFRFTIYMPDG